MWQLWKKSIIKPQLCKTYFPILIPAFSCSLFLSSFCLNYNLLNIWQPHLNKFPTPRFLKLRQFDTYNVY